MSASGLSVSWVNVTVCDPLKVNTITSPIVMLVIIAPSQSPTINVRVCGNNSIAVVTAINAGLAADVNASATTAPIGSGLHSGGDARNDLEQLCHRGLDAIREDLDVAGAVPVAGHAKVEATVVREDRD